jgi:hypothetical protein
MDCAFLRRRRRVAIRVASSWSTATADAPPREDEVIACDTAIEQDYRTHFYGGLQMQRHTTAASTCGTTPPINGLALLNRSSTRPLVAGNFALWL